METLNLEVRVQTLERMLEITLAALLAKSTPAERETVQKMLAEIEREDLAPSPASAHKAREYVGAVALRLGQITCAA